MTTTKKWINFKFYRKTKKKLCTSDKIFPKNLFSAATF